METIHKCSERWIRHIITSVLLLYFLTGVIGYVVGEHVYEKHEMNGHPVEVGKEALSMKLIGNDYSINRISFPIDSFNGEDNSVLYVYFTKADNDLTSAEVLDKKIFAGSELKNMSEIILNYPTIENMTIDRDYYITFVMDVGTLSLAGADMSVVNLYEGDTELSGNLAYSVDFFRHNNRWLFLWKFFFIVLSLTALIVVLSGIGFYRALELFVIFAGTVLYIFGLCDRIQYVGIISIVLACTAMVVLLVMLWKQPDRSIGMLSKYAGDIAFWVVLMLLFAVHDHGMLVKAWDEGSHWATAVKNMFLFDKMYIHVDSTVTSYRYPPIYSLFQYWFLKVNSAYDVGIMHFAKHFMESAVFLGVVEHKLKKRTKSIYVLLATFLVGIPDIMMGADVASGFYNSLYADITLGIMFAMVIGEYLRVKEKLSIQGMILLGISSLLMILTKDNGMVLWASLLFGILCNIFYEFFRCRGEIKRSAFAMISMITGFVVARVSWSMFIRGHIEDLNITFAAQTSALATTRLSLGKIKDFLTGNGPAYQYAIIVPHIKKIFLTTDFQKYGVGFSFAAIIAVGFSILFAMGCKSVRKEKEIHNLILFTASSVAVVGIYHIIYTFTMSEAEAIVFASEIRYLGSFLIGMSVFVLDRYFESIAETNEMDSKVKKTAIITIAIVAYMTNFLGNFREAVFAKDPVSKVAVEAKVIRDNLREEDRVYFVSSGETGGNYVMLQYELTPIKLNPRFFTRETGELYTGYMPRITAGPYEYQASELEMEMILRDYDYFYIQHSDERFAMEYEKLFGTKENVHDFCLYRILQDVQGNVRLEPELYIS